MKKLFTVPGARTGLTLALAAVLVTTVLLKTGRGQHASADNAPQQPHGSNSPQTDASIQLTESQLFAIKVAPLSMRPFPLEKEATGIIDYDQDLSVQVYSPYPGKIITPLAELGDPVQQGQPLYTIASPDLIQAESTLISAAATAALTSRELSRVEELFGTNGVSEREIEQATSEQQTAEGVLKAARDAVRLFGKTDSQIDQIASSRKIDPALVVCSPVAGWVTARNAQPGLLVQPGNPAAPYAVSDLGVKWMLANVTESDCPFLRPGQYVSAQVSALPGRIFEGTISRMSPALDPNTHRLMVRCEISDANHELRPGMLAGFVIRVHDPVASVALPSEGVVRNGDGTMCAWVTEDQRRFSRRLVKLGLRREGFYQVLDGLRAGELAVTDGAIFLSNMLDAPPAD